MTYNVFGGTLNPTLLLSLQLRGGRKMHTTGWRPQHLSYESVYSPVAEMLSLETHAAVGIDALEFHESLCGTGAIQL